MPCRFDRAARDISGTGVAVDSGTGVFGNQFPCTPAYSGTVREIHCSSGVNGNCIRYLAGLADIGTAFWYRFELTELREKKKRADWVSNLTKMLS